MMNVSASYAVQYPSPENNTSQNGQRVPPQSYQYNSHRHAYRTHIPGESNWYHWATNWQLRVTIIAVTIKKLCPWVLWAILVKNQIYTKGEWTVFLLWQKKRTKTQNKQTKTHESTLNSYYLWLALEAGKFQYELVCNLWRPTLTMGCFLSKFH